MSGFHEQMLSVVDEAVRAGVQGHRATIALRVAKGCCLEGRTEVIAEDLRRAVGW